ncbi:hypothetical protein BDV96DRAFT_360162 [Lophiotrema nucula]|uniref:Uncharacterized protein n=1 Tax=Lophiotrema nucula TaxID=690887 RepID=A0A6A5YEQ9_9PLEO|nr:hypothetical protein BDV96DRAFT_360162 [Lophiotrema nucula]
MADRRPLIHESSDLSDTANISHALPSLGFTPQSHSLQFHTPPNVSPPSSPPRTSYSRPGYSRLGSDATAVERRNVSGETLHEVEEEDISESFRARSGSGLGIASPVSPPANTRRVSIQTIPRVPIGNRNSPIKSPNTLSPPGTGNPLLGGFPRDSPRSTPDLRRERYSPRDEPESYEEFRSGILKKSRSSDGSLRDGADYQRYIHNEDTERLRKGAPSIKSAYESDFRPTQECPTSRDFYQSRFSWLSITVIIICLFSTVFSAIFLGLAWKGPRYGRRITTHGSLKPGDAIVLTSVMAKLIELSFVTSFVAFLGQVLSRRAFMKEQGRGVTLSELSMWRWVVQPGTLITHWETAKYAGLSILGILSLLSAILATLYAPAATALVQPTLKFGKWEHRVLAGSVSTSFSNVNYVRDRICQTPIRTDTEYGGSTCLQIEHAAQGYHNYQRYLALWKQASDVGNGTTEQTQRPPGFGLLYENTTITAQWINVADTVNLSKKFSRAINNVSLAMPHSGIFQAARDQRNDILQPEELNSEGVYSLRAAVPSPVLHVLCANLNKDELRPIVYDAWPNSKPVNIGNWDLLRNDATTTNVTVVDEIFGWNDQERKHYPPVFARYPAPFNTIMNHTSYPWGRESIYILGQGGQDKLGPDLTGTYVLCQIKASLTPNCGTRYNATGSGGTMEALCENDEDDMTYIKSLSNATKVLDIADWRDIGFDWSNSMSLNTGIMDANASNSRLFTQLILQKNNKGEIDLNPALPSPGEALAVMSGCTLLMASQDSPFVEFWNYSVNPLAEPTTQYFNASVRAQQYGSGGVDDVSKAWIVVLLLVFLMNVFVLIYFLFHRGLVTDFSEPPNLFALAVNSPPSHLLAGSCGGGPEGKQYVVNWFVNTEGDHLYMEPGQRAMFHGHGVGHGLAHMHSHHPHTHASMPPSRVQPTSNNKGSIIVSVSAGLNSLRDRIGGGFGRSKEQPLMRPISIVETPTADYEMEAGFTPTQTQKQYAKLAKRRSML